VIRTKAIEKIATTTSATLAPRIMAKGDSTRICSCQRRRGDPDCAKLSSPGKRGYRRSGNHSSLLSADVQRVHSTNTHGSLYQITCFGTHGISARPHCQTSTYECPGRNPLIRSTLRETTLKPTRAVLVGLAAWTASGFPGVPRDTAICGVFGRGEMERPRRSETMFSAGSVGPRFLEWTNCRKGRVQ
jgi:hypothetical protein